MHNITQSSLRLIEHQLPPAAERRRIIAKLGTLTASLDRARRELDLVQTLATRLRQQTARAASDGSLTTDWRKLHGNFAVASDEVLDEAYQRVFGSPRRRPFTQIEWRPNLRCSAVLAMGFSRPSSCSGASGSSAKTSDDADGVPVLRMGNIQRGELDWTDLKFLPTKHSEFPNLFLEVGDILFNRTNSFELVGKTAVCRVLDRPE